MRIFKKINILRQRTGLLLVVFFVIGLVIIGRLFQLQIIKHDYYIKASFGQHQIDRELLQSRGEVFIHDFREQGLTPLILNRRLFLIYAVPKEIINPKDTAHILAEILEPDKEKRKIFEKRIFEKLNKKNDPYEPVQHKVSEKLSDDIKNKNLAGIYVKDEWERFYPEKEAAAQITGFLGYKGDRRVGQYGVEGYFEKILSGRKGRISGVKDVYGRLIPVSEKELKQAENGFDIILTLDKVVQNKAYEIIKESVKKYGAKNGTMIIMDPLTGNIKAMVNFPSFDPNNYNKAESINVFSNLAVSEAYEPGSIFKIITMAAALDSGAVEVDDTYFDKGFVTLGDYTIRNADNKKFGEITMTKILENSVNTGAVFIALKTGKNQFKNYVENFGFGKVAGIGFFGQAKGNIFSLNKKGDIYLVTASYGQGITVTPLQMARALSIIVNNGKMVTPKLVDYIRKENGEIININKNKEQQIISQQTATLLKAMLVSVVKNGHGLKAQVHGYYIGGKTGTAEIAKSKMKGYSNRTNHSFVGFGTLDNPKFVVIVKLKEPKYGRFSAVTAAPTFAKMADFLLQYYQIPPEVE